MKKTIVIGIICMATISLVVFFNFLFKYLEKKNINNSNNQVTTIPYEEEKDTKDQRIVIDIKGAVYYPGVYVFYKEDTIINDCIIMAGGLLPEADVSGINLAQIVTSNTSIYITYKAQEDISSFVISEENIEKYININTASITDLLLLNGIGESLARRIVDYRKTNGFFKRIEDIKNVSGIGDAIFEKIKDHIKV